jgi:DNA-binding XRE family transcriptional regulator
MPVLGPRRHDLRIHDSETGSTWRVVYRADADEIVVVDVFAKKTQATPKQAIALCKQRLRDWDRDDSTRMAMDAKKKRKLQKMGGRVATVAEFIDLSEAEAAVVELRLELAGAVRKKRAAAGMTQAQLAKAIGSSQARVAKMEGGDPQASIESLVRALAALGAKARLKVA